MRFTFTGTLDGRPVSGEVRDGELTGDDLLRARVSALVASGATVGWGPVSKPASLTDPYVARSTVAAVLDPDTAAFEGDETPVDPEPPLPEADPLPPQPPGS